MFLKSLLSQIIKPHLPHITLEKRMSNEAKKTVFPPSLLSKNQDEVEQRQQQVAIPHLHSMWVPT